MRKFICAFALVCVGAFSFGQTATLTGHVADPSSAPNTQTTKLRFELAGCSGNQPRYNGVSLIWPVVKDYPANSSGDVASTIYRNDYITCGSSVSSNFWNQSVVVNGVQGPKCPVRIAATTFDATNPSCLTNVPVVTAPTGDSTYCRIDFTNCNTSYMNLVTNQSAAGNKTFSGATTLSGGVSGATTFSALTTFSSGLTSSGTNTFSSTSNFTGTVNCKNLEAIRCADGFSGGSNAAKINAAATDLSSNPGYVYIPSSMGTGLWSVPSYNVGIFDTRFTNDPGVMEGSLPQAHSHWLFDFHAGANQTGIDTTTNAGHWGLSVTAYADAGGTAGQDAQANVVALFGSCIQSGSSVRPCWGGNFVTTYVTTTNISSGAEIDLNNNSAADDTGTKGAALRLVCGGLKTCGSAIEVTNSISNDFWEHGFNINNYKSYGIRLASGGPRAASDIYIVPPADDTNKTIIVRNHADAANVFTVDDSGNVAGTNFSPTLLTINGGTPIVKHLSAVATLNFGVPGAVPGCSTDQTITVTGAVLGETVSLGSVAPPANTQFTAFVSGADTVSVRFCQFAGVAADPDASGGLYRVDVWKH